MKKIITALIFIILSSCASRQPEKITFEFSENAQVQLGLRVGYGDYVWGPCGPNKATWYFNFEFPSDFKKGTVNAQNMIVRNGAGVILDLVGSVNIGDGYIEFFLSPQRQNDKNAEGLPPNGRYSLRKKL